MAVKHNFKFRDDAEKESYGEFIDGVKKDVYLEESLFIMHDIFVKVPVTAKI